MQQITEMCLDTCISIFEIYSAIWKQTSNYILSRDI